MKTLEELRQIRAANRRQLRAAHEAAIKGEVTIVVSDDARERFEEACRPKQTSSPDASGAKNTWVRC